MKWNIHNNDVCLTVQSSRQQAAATFVATSEKKLVMLDRLLYCLLVCFANQLLQGDWQTFCSITQLPTFLTGCQPTTSSEQTQKGVTRITQLEQ